MVGLGRRFFARATPLSWLITANVAIYVVSVLIALGFYLAGRIGLFEVYYHKLALPGSPYLLLHQPWSLITHMFIHDWRGFWHILINMLWLYWMGQLFMTTQPPLRLLWAYGLGGLGGIIGFLAYAWSHAPYGGYALGASAAVNGVFFATVALMPNFRVFLFIFGPIALKWLALVWIFLDILLTLGGNEATAIAHLSGAGAGLLLGYLLSRGWRPERLGNYKLSLLREKEVTPEEIDRILDKINQKGLHSLTKRERETLKKAAERL
ncbi:MAG: rhomboid family intramembrane serine protease [Bacteroidia bacterium]|nr:rhomboid family intramembrane serine protease [Bacteroidia bacterium]MCX7653046.1 rhomboid family intramembrane serine protease [Bacteroidia bacterium]MDW8416184.1 rhomboid family intramembrane serine protease [Bacteroidia bacterium]